MSSNAKQHSLGGTTMARWQGVATELESLEKPPKR